MIQLTQLLLAAAALAQLIALSREVTAVFLNLTQLHLQVVAAALGKRLMLVTVVLAAALVTQPARVAQAFLAKAMTAVWQAHRAAVVVAVHQRLARRVTLAATVATVLRPQLTA
jgi:hypothetical protein